MALGAGEALEAAIGSAVPALAKDGLGQRDSGRCGGVEVRPRGADAAVRGPAVDEVGGVGEVLARVLVPVGGRDDGGVVGGVGHDVVAHQSSDVGASRHREGPALAEVALEVHEDECATSHVGKAIRFGAGHRPSSTGQIPRGPFSARGPHRQCW